MRTKEEARDYSAVYYQCHKDERRAELRAAA